MIICLKRLPSISSGLHFRDDDLRDEFLTAWPHYRIEKQIEKLEQERNVIAARIEQKLERGGFDLSKIHREHRWKVASRYCKARQEIHDREVQVRLLKEAIRLKEVWLEKLLPADSVHEAKHILSRLATEDPQEVLSDYLMGGSGDEDGNDR